MALPPEDMMRNMLPCAPKVTLLGLVLVDIGFTTTGLGPSADVSTVLSKDRDFTVGSVTPDVELVVEVVRTWPGSMRPEPWDNRDVTPEVDVLWN